MQLPSIAECVPFGLTSKINEQTNRDKIEITAGCEVLEGTGALEEED